jgi:hypothetical protein
MELTFPDDFSDPSFLELEVVMRFFPSLITQVDVYKIDDMNPSVCMQKAKMVSTTMACKSKRKTVEEEQEARESHKRKLDEDAEVLGQTLSEMRPKMRLVADGFRELLNRDPTLRAIIYGPPRVPSALPPQSLKDLFS